MPRVAPFCFNQTHFFFFQCCVNLIVSIYLKYWVDPRKTLKAERRRITLFVTEYLVRNWTCTRHDKVPGAMSYPSTWLEFYSYSSWQSTWCICTLPRNRDWILTSIRDKVTGAFVSYPSTWLDSYSYSLQSTWHICTDVIEILLVFVMIEYLVLLDSYLYL